MALLCTKLRVASRWFSKMPVRSLPTDDIQAKADTAPRKPFEHAITALINARDQAFGGSIDEEGSKRSPERRFCARTLRRSEVPRRCSLGGELSYGGGFQTNFDDPTIPLCCPPLLIE